MEWVGLLGDPMMRPLYLRALLGGSAAMLMCAALSPLVVVKRLGFVGQGVSHAAFGGVGVAAVLAAGGLLTPGDWLEWIVITLSCVAAALGMASISDKRSTPVDTAIAMVLVGAMALGAVLVQASERLAVMWGNPPMASRWEAVLFGSSVLTVGRGEVIGGWAAAACVLGGLWWWRRPVMFWALDEDSARAFGVATGRTRVLLLVLLAVAVVTAMKLAGVILATALLVLPGATALKLTDRLGRCVLLSCACSLVSLVVGLTGSVVLDWQAGPSIVMAMLMVFAAVSVAGKLRAKRSNSAAVVATTPQR